MQTFLACEGCEKIPEIEQKETKATKKRKKDPETDPEDPLRRSFCWRAASSLSGFLRCLRFLLFNPLLSRGADPVGKGAFNNAMGLMVDPSRKLVWAVGQNSHVRVLRLDVRNLRLVELK